MYNNYPLACVINEESINMRLYQTSIRFCLQNKEEDSNQSRTWKGNPVPIYYVLWLWRLRTQFRDRKSWTIPRES